MESLLEILRKEYPQQRIESQYLQLESHIFIIINVSSRNGNNTPISGKVFQCFGDKYTPIYNEIVLNHKYISIQVSDIRDCSLIGRLENGQLVKLSYNKQDNQFIEK
ncbi:MAG: hypothetical protein IKL50_06660 [Bacteroidales bacterium]|nr:hypothetical protein [Bacteroidales bacterium]